MSATLVIRNEEAATVFSLLGGDENAATFAFGWTLSRSNTLLLDFLRRLNLGTPPENVRIELQRHATDGGFTDIELIAPGYFHIIVEAKVGSNVAGAAQLKRYRTRFGATQTGQHIVSISAAPNYAASLVLIPEVDGIPVSHLSWSDVQRLVRNATRTVSALNERRWLSDLEVHLEGYVAAHTTNSNIAYVVALSDKEIAPGYTWIDVVERDSAYFHPIGRGGWPNIAPNYLGFRYNGFLQSVRHVEESEFVVDLGQRNERWAQWTDHMLYRLGPAMRPATPLRSGMTYANRVYCEIDLLLSGACSTIKAAQEETVRRSQKQR